jgi:hypothetical protein
MSDDADTPPPVGAYWIREEDHEAVRALFEDGARLPPTHAEWLKMAEEMKRGLEAYGHPVLKVTIDPATFPQWCAGHGLTPGPAARRRFVAEAVAERYGRPARG